MSGNTKPLVRDSLDSGVCCWLRKIPYRSLPRRKNAEHQGDALLKVLNCRTTHLSDEDLLHTVIKDKLAIPCVTRKGDFFGHRVSSNILQLADLSANDFPHIHREQQSATGNLK